MTTLHVTLDDEETARLTERAARSGKPMELLVRDLIREYVRPTTWAEAVKPIREAMAGHGMTENDSLAFFEAEREAMWAERRAAGSAGDDGSDLGGVKP